MRRRSGHNLRQSQGGPTAGVPASDRSFAHSVYDRERRETATHLCEGAKA
jgi:hypothetical protein